MASRVVLADDSVLALERLMAVLARADEIEVAATAGTRGAALYEIETHEPDGLISDIRMPPTHVDQGIALAAEPARGPPADGRRDPEQLR